MAERAARNPGAVTQICARIAGSSRFQGLIFAVIVFLAELAIRITAHGRRPQHFFRDGWNVFDFVVITAAFIPGLRQNATLLRLVRLLRIMRIISVLPDVRVLLRGMTRSLPPIASMAVLALLLIYLYGMVGWILFGSEDPRRWGDLGAAMLSLFVMLTLEEWPTYLRAGMDVHPWSWIYFVSYVLVAGFLLINILIGIVINAMEGARREERAAARALRQELLAARAEHEAARAEREAARAEHEELAQLMQTLRDTVEDLEDRLGDAPMVSAGDDRRMRLG